MVATAQFNSRSFDTASALMMIINKGHRCVFEGA